MSKERDGRVEHPAQKGHTLVEGIPQSKIEDGRTVLEIRLITGKRLVFDGDAKKFSVNY